MLHGRAAELADIHRLLADARAGHSSMLGIQGEAGSGKTALLEQVADCRALAVRSQKSAPPPRFDEGADL